jgi:drug/metabolite transporter (DMT)-like permease
MQNSLLYIITVLIWGSTWLAIRFQLGVVAPELSVAYRFFLASALLFIYSAWKRLPLRFSARQHAFMAMQGLFLFSVNYILVYIAEGFVTSGLVAVIFSSIIILNVFFGALFLGSPVRGRVVIGALVGMLGLALIFWPELSGFDLGSGRALGLTLAVISSVSASLGNIVSARNQRNELPVIQTNAYGMAYGATFTLLIAFSRGAVFSFDPSFAYVASMLYLALFGSVIAFGSYLTLLGRIGADRAAYITIIFPVIALLLSALFEDFSMNSQQFIGVALILLGNVIVLRRRKSSPGS